MNHFLPPFSKRANLPWFDGDEFAKDHAFVEKKKEESGNFTYLYDAKHIAARNRKKETRLKKLSKSLKKMRDKVKGDLTHEEEKIRLAALAVALIDETYERVGNEESASELKHYGVTGWLVKHVALGKSKATIKYVGKAGVKQSKEVKNKAVLKALRKACEGKKKGDRVLEGITAKDVNAYLTPFKITAKDIRGYHANKEMLRSLKANGKPPKGDQKAIKERFKKALEDAAKKVGHEPGTLKRQYLIPRIEQYYMEGKSVKGILASDLPVPLSKRAAALMDIPPRMAEDAVAWVLQAHANLCLALHRPPPPAEQVEGDLAAFKALEQEAKTDAQALRAGSWDDTAKAEEAMLPRWDGRKAWLRLSSADGVPQGLFFVARRIQPGHWAYGVTVQRWSKNPPLVPGMAPGSGYMLSTVLSRLAEKIEELTLYRRPPTADDYRRHEELEKILRETAAGAPPLDIIHMDSSYGQEKEFPVNISGWRYERLVTSGLPWDKYILEVAAQAPRDAAAAYYKHQPSTDSSPGQLPRIVVYAGRQLRPWSVELLKVEQDSLAQSVRHEMVHLAQDLLKGALRLKMLAGMPPMAVRERELNPSGFARLSPKRTRRLRKMYPGSTFPESMSTGLQVKHQLRDVEFHSNLRDSIEEWRRQAAKMDPDRRLQFLKFWVKGDHMGYYEHGGVPSAVFSASDVFRTLYNEARHDRAKRDRWAAAVRIISKEVADMLEAPKTAALAVPISRRAGLRPGVLMEYIWLWDDGARRLLAKANVKDGREIKGVEHMVLVGESGMSLTAAREAPRGFVTFNTDGSVEVTTYGTPFSALLDSHPRAYNAVERKFELMPGSYIQHTLPMPRSSREELVGLPESAETSLPKRAAAGQFLLFAGGFPIAWFPSEKEAEAAKAKLVDGFLRGESILWDYVRMESRSPFALMSMVDPTATMPNFDAFVEFLRTDPRNRPYLKRYAETVASVHRSPQPIDSDRVPPGHMAKDLFELADSLPSPDLPGFDWDALARASDEMNNLIESMAGKMAKGLAQPPLSKRAASKEEKELTFLYQLAAEALKEIGGYQALEYRWQRDLFDDAADALWRKDLPRAAHYIDQILRHIVDRKTAAVSPLPLSKRAALRYLYHYAPPEAREDIAANGLKTPQILVKEKGGEYLERYRERTAETLGKPKGKVTVGDVVKGLEKRRETMFDGPGGSRALSAFLDPIPEIQGLHGELREFAAGNDLWRIDYAAALRDGIVEKAAVVEERPRSERPVEPKALLRELEGSPIPGAQWREKGKFYFSGKTHAMIVLREGVLPAKYVNLAKQSWDDRPPLSRRAKPAEQMDGKTPGAPPG